MGALSVAHVLVTPLRQIATEGGDVWHGMKANDPGYAGFGEAYFSCVSDGAVKAWKRHTRMTMNLVVPLGCVRFAFSDDGSTASRVEVAGPERYVRITVPPGIWFGFQGRHAPVSMVLNLASIPHDSTEVERRGVADFTFDWQSP